MQDQELTIIGGGLAGCEAAWQAAARGIAVRLYEMRPQRFSPAHSSENLAELVCSNSLKSESLTRGGGLLKAELRRAGSLILEAADACRVPAGEALAVNRINFAAYVTDKISAHPKIELIRQEATEIPEAGVVIIAAGPLISDALTIALAKLTGSNNLYFYDAIAPIVAADSIDRSIVWQASRHDRGEAAYLNCPLSEDEYHVLVDELNRGQKMPSRNFEKEIYYSGCLPVEEMAARGVETLAHGPLKPIGLVDPRTGLRPYAVVQLRSETEDGRMYNLVGFQTRLTYPEQERVFRLIPGLANAHFLRLGSCHRNSFINAPLLIDIYLSLKNCPRIKIAGQLCGVEGYVESTAAGFWAGGAAAAELLGLTLPPPPPTTMLGALLNYLVTADPLHFQPMAANFGLFPPPEKRLRRRERQNFFASRAQADFGCFLAELDRIRSAPKPE